MKISTFPFDLSASTKASVCSSRFWFSQVLLHLRPYLVERHGASRLLLGDLDDVIAEVGLDQLADRARRQGEGGVVERADHLPLLEEAEVAAIGGAARILGVFLGEGCEVLARLDVLQHLFGLRARLRLGGGVGVLREGNQDVAGADALRLLELIGILRVEVVHLRRGDGDLGGHFILNHLRDGHVLAGVAAHLLEGQLAAARASA